MRKTNTNHRSFFSCEIGATKDTPTCQSTQQPPPHYLPTTNLATKRLKEHCYLHI